MAIKLGGIAVDCADSESLASFYAELFGWNKGEMWGSPVIEPEDKSISIYFMQEDDYVPPVWPEEEGKQQKSIHLDFVTDNYEETVEKALRLGAVKASLQVAPDHFTVLIDPQGHPFCMCRMSE